jgi:DNA-directed RNA polymerase specialized sigma24 family protein
MRRSGGGTVSQAAETEFEHFVADVEPRLRRALVAAYGPDVGREATVDPLAWAWENRQRLASFANPAGYLFRVGQSQARRRRTRPLFDRPAADDPWVEPKLSAALAALPTRQRIAVFLVHGEGWAQSEVAELLGLRAATVQTHVDRAMAKLRVAIKGDGR